MKNKQLKKSLRKKGKVKKKMINVKGHWVERCFFGTVFVAIAVSILRFVEVQILDTTGEVSYNVKFVK